MLKYEKSCVFTTVNTDRNKQVFECVKEQIKTGVRFLDFEDVKTQKCKSANIYDFMFLRFNVFMILHFYTYTRRYEQI